MNQQYLPSVKNHIVHMLTDILVALWISCIAEGLDMNYAYHKIRDFQFKISLDNSILLERVDMSGYRRIMTLLGLLSCDIEMMNTIIVATLLLFCYNLVYEQRIIIAFQINQAMDSVVGTGYSFRVG